MNDKQRVLDMYCGSKSIGNAFEGQEVFTMDCEAKFNPTWIMDILKPFDVFWASPPCTTFSVASIGTHWTGGKEAYIPRTEKAKQGLEILNRTIGLIAVLKPKYWYIENPRGVMRKVINDIFKRWGITQYKRNTITYCQYGDKRMKPTDVWTNNFEWCPKPMCKNGDSCHESAPRGSRTGTQGLKDNFDRSKIPEELCREIVEVSCTDTSKNEGENNGT